MTWQDIYAPFRAKISGYADRFESDTINTQQHQEGKLFEILQANQLTEFGALNGFSKITSISEFQERVPISDYSSYAKEFLQGDSKRFITAPVQHFAWTSGTDSLHKWIPISSGLTRDFEAALLPWFDNLLATYPTTSSGPAYWIVGPQIRASLRQRGEEMDDTKYFTPDLMVTLLPLLSLPPAISGEEGFREWAFATLLHLILERELSWISVWSPTLLIRLLKCATELRPLLLQSLGLRSCDGVDLKLSPDSIKLLNHRLLEKRSEIDRVVEILTNSTPLAWREVWPNLAVCSCWKDGWAGLFLPELTSLLPGVPIQGKGLLATEAVVSIPFNCSGSDDPILAYRSHFFEFRSLESDQLFLAHQLRVGEQYEMLVTTNGGLYRYELGDVVHVTGYVGHAPRFRFVGKRGLIADLCGEKLHESHVAQCLQLLSEAYRISLADAFVRPVVDREYRYYQLVLPESGISIAADLGKELDSALSGNPHYDACRRMQQLGPVRVVEGVRQNAKGLSSTAKHFCLQTEPVISQPA